MDQARFDAWTRALGNGGTRRGLIHGAAGSALAWLGQSRLRTPAAAQELPTGDIIFPVQPVCTCPEGLVLCQGLCVRPQDCKQVPGGAGLSGSDLTPLAEEEAAEPAQVGEAACPPQEQLCAAKGICVPCPTAMSLDENCRCTCLHAPDTRCDVACDCPKVASCSCVCPGPPCQPPYVQNADTCKCICPNRCRSPKQLDAVCNCVCPDHEPCAGGKTWDEQACGCVCEKTCPPDAILNSESCDCVCDTVVVPTDGSTVISSLNLIAGRLYTIRVSGKFDISLGATRLADAEYVFDPNDNQQTNDCGAYAGSPGHPRGDIGLTIDDPTRTKPQKTPLSWGPYTKSHVYTTTVTGKGAPISLTYNDCDYSDNRGTLTVEILCDCPDLASCPDGKVFDDKRCQCVCLNTCRRPFRLDPTTCECVCFAGQQRCGDRCIACPTASTLNPDFCDCVCDTIVVPTDGSTVESKLLLTKGRNYKVRVSGKFDISLGATRLADAEYVFDPNDNQQTNDCGAYAGSPGHPSGDIGLTIDDPTRTKPQKTPLSWGPYTKSHVYTTTVIGKGAPISLTYNDCDYSDNRGALTVEILCPSRRDDSPESSSGTGIAQPEATSVPTPPPTSTPVAGVTGTSGATGASVGPPTSTPTPPPTSTPGPTGPTTCVAGELLCVDRCIPASDCPAEKCCFDSSTCACACPDCGENFVFDPARCACVCALGECPPNWVRDEIGCSCVCQPTPCAPGSNWQFDQESCSCVCQPTECPANMQFDEASCSCLCVPPECPTNWQVDEASCSCVCVPLACPANFQFDAATCSCFCTELGCAEGEVFDSTSCTCVESGSTGEAEGTT